MSDKLYILSRDILIPDEGWILHDTADAKCIGQVPPVPLRLAARVLDSPSFYQPVSNASQTDPP